MSSDLLFVYGTLRKKTAKSRHDMLAAHCRYFADGYLHGRLYEVDGYPGAIASDNPDDRVHGELYELTDAAAALSKLDHYEECSDDFLEPHEYVRKQLPIQLPDGGSVLAWTYLYNRDVRALKLIPSGDYLNATSGA